MNDIIEIVCDNEYFRRKLIVSNNKPQKKRGVRKLKVDDIKNI